MFVINPEVNSEFPTILSIVPELQMCLLPIFQHPHLNETVKLEYIQHSPAFFLNYVQQVQYYYHKLFFFRRVVVVVLPLVPVIPNTGLFTLKISIISLTSRTGMFFPE